MRRHRHSPRSAADRRRPPTDVSLRGLSTMAALVLAVTLVLLGVTYPVVVASLALGIGGLVAVRLGES